MSRQPSATATRSSGPAQSLVERLCNKSTVLIRTQDRNTTGRPMPLRVTATADRKGWIGSKRQSVGSRPGLWGKRGSLRGPPEGVSPDVPAGMLGQPGVHPLADHGRLRRTLMLGHFPEEAPVHPSGLDFLGHGLLPFPGLLPCSTSRSPAVTAATHTVICNRQRRR